MGPAGISTSPVWEKGDPVASRPDDYVAPSSKEGDRQLLLKPPLERPAKTQGASGKQGGTGTMSSAQADFLCLNAPKGMAKPVPAPFSRWAVLVCSEQGQALVPAEGMAWVVDGAGDTVSILALPPGKNAKPAAPGFDPRYAYRFTGFIGQKAEGERRKRAAALLAQASGKKNAPSADEIWQLDAVSNIGATRYNIFFYLQGGEPTHMIACLDQCREALFLDVLKGRDANAALGAGSLRK